MENDLGNGLKIIWSGSSPEVVIHPAIHDRCKSSIQKRVASLTSQHEVDLAPAWTLQLGDLSKSVSLPSYSKLRLRILSVCGRQVHVDASLTS